MKLKRGVIPIAIIGALLVSLFAPLAVSAAEGSPVLPTSFYGDVTVNDTPAPVDTVITGRIVDAVGSPGEGTITVTEEGKYGDPGYLIVTTDSPDDVDKEIEFYVELPGWAEAQKAGQTATYDSHTHQVNLNVVMGDVVPPTVTIDIPDYINAANEASVPVTITSNEDGTYSYTISDGTVAHDVIGTGSITGGVDVELSVDLSGLDEVSVTADASVEDATGNTGNAPTDTAIKDTTAPTVSITSPVDGDIDVAIDATVNATFDEDVTAADLSGITIDVATGVLATLVEATDTLTIAHDAFALDTSYTVTIPAGAVNDLAGNPNALYTWSFTTTEVEVTYYTLTMAVSGSGTTEPVVGEHSYPADEVVSITAIPASGWRFAGWTTTDMTEIADASSALTTVTVDKDKTVTATFTEIIGFTTTLSAGWNLLSTPVKLDVASDAVEQIFDAQSLASIEIFYSWDGVNWVLRTSGYQFLPLEATYVKVSSGASATAEFIPSQEPSWPPSRELPRGLNLIGPAPAFDLEAGVFPAMLLNQALDNIAEAESGLKGYTIVVSPAHNQPGWAYALGMEVKDLLPYKGYWVVMENADTLYGFSTTPIE